MDAEIERQRFKRYAPEVGLLLWALWDPIGVAVPLDEYSNYVPAVWKLLSRDATVAEIAAELRHISEEQIGVGAATDRSHVRTERAGFEPATHLSERTRFPVALHGSRFSLNEAALVGARTSCAPPC